MASVSPFDERFSSVIDRSGQHMRPGDQVKPSKASKWALAIVAFAIAGYSLQKWKEMSPADPAPPTAAQILKRQQLENFQNQIDAKAKVMGPGKPMTTTMSVDGVTYELTRGMHDNRTCFNNIHPTSVTIGNAKLPTFACARTQTFNDVDGVMVRGGGAPQQLPNPHFEQDHGLGYSQARPISGVVGRPTGRVADFNR